MSQPLPLQDKDGRLVIPVEFFFNNDLEYLKAGNKEKTYSSSITKTPAASYTMEGIEDMIPTLWSPFILAYDKDAALGISHWGPQHQYGKEIWVWLLEGNSYKLFNLDGDVIVDFVTTLKMFTQGIVFKNRVEDVQLGVESYQRKLNLTKPQRTCQYTSVKEPYTPNYDPPGIIYEDNIKKKRLMHLEEIHKFCDGTL
ncbi:hypothetical protein Tco_1401438 [Tanacetum coccineum]